MQHTPSLDASPSGHTHDDEGEQHHCPTCNQEISRRHFEEIRARIESEDRQHARDVEERVAREHADAEAKAAARIAAVEQAAAAQAVAVKEATEVQLREAEQAKAREIAAARDEATKVANVANEAKVAEAWKKTKTAEEQLETLKTSQAEQLLAVRDEATKVANVANESKVAEAFEKAKAATAQLDALKAAQEKTLNERLAEQREALEENAAKAVNLSNAEHFKERQKFEEQVAKLTRQLQRKTADELGEGAEIDLFESLREEFPQDSITRVKKGEPGADILQEIKEGEATCGLFVYDSKNRKAWRNDYVDKLRLDQLAEKADHAILSTHVFPSGTSQLHVQDGVILVNPARAVMVATILRKLMLQIHSLRLSNEAREEKTALVYSYITSDQFDQRLRQIDDLALDMLDLEVKEKKAHDATWTKRGTLIRSVQRAQGEISCEIDRIVGQGISDVAAAG
jgi:hypothetical protein